MRKVPVSMHTYDGRLRLEKVDAIVPPVNLLNFALAVATFTTGL